MSGLVRNCSHHLTTVLIKVLFADAVNTMISDATGLFPRLCSSLADIVFQKTKGALSD
jgi:hypothetical protein